MILIIVFVLAVIYIAGTTIFIETKQDEYIIEDNKKS